MKFVYPWLPMWLVTLATYVVARASEKKKKSFEVNHIKCL